MRETRLEKGGERRVLRTDDAGTKLLDAAGRVAAEHGNDRHEMLLAELRAEGWAVVADGHVAPEGATGRPPGNIAGDRGARGPAATASEGEDA